MTTVWTLSSACGVQNVYMQGYIYIYASTAWCLTPGIKRTYTIQMLYRCYTDATCISEADWMVAGLGSHLPNNLLHMQCSQPGFAQSTGQTKKQSTEWSTCS